MEAFSKLTKHSFLQDTLEKKSYTGTMCHHESLQCAQPIGNQCAVKITCVGVIDHNANGFSYVYNIDGRIQNCFEYLFL